MQAAVTPGVDVLGGALAQLRVAEVGHVGVPARESLRGGPRPRLAHHGRRIERLAQREIDDGVVAVFGPQPLALGEHPPDPAAGLHLRGGPAGQRRAVHRAAQAIDSVPRIPPVCHENGYSRSTS